MSISIHSTPSLSSLRVPVNIITGFLGVGKTTAIKHLLQVKPPGENWAVLVNEFGEIGIDGAILKQEGVQVKEVPGGCMCCANGLPMQIALNLLLARKPDRLLIEPSGLGHPDEVIAILQSQYYVALVDIQPTITLVDPRKLKDDRYLNNDNFKRQAMVADRIVANKTDQCTSLDRQRFESWIDGLGKQPMPACGWVTQGQLKPSWLTAPASHSESSQPAAPGTGTGTGTGTAQHYQTSLAAASPLSSLFLDFPALEKKATEKVIRKEKFADGFYSCGWCFPARQQFDLVQLLGWVHGIKCVRLKGVVKTISGACVINSNEGVVSTFSIPEAADSRIEIIAEQTLPWKALETSLGSCML